MYRNERSHRVPSTLLALSLAALLLLGPAPAALAAPSDGSPAWGWLADLYGSLASLFGGSETPTEAGPDMDPDGLTTTDDGGEAGPGMDPNGATTDDGGDAGIDMDPDGLNATGDGDAGPDMDPNG